MCEILVTTEEFQDSPVGIIPKDWDFKALSELADVDRGKFTYRPRNDPRLYGGSYPFIQTGDIASASGGILTTYSQTLNERGISVSRQFPIGTIAITIAANIADSAILGIPMYFPDSVVGAVVKKPNSIRYVELCIHRAKPKLEARAPQSAQKNINLEDLRPLLIPVPSTEEQQKIAEIIDTIDKAIALTDTHITKLKKAKAGLLHDLITRGIDEHGELRDPTRNPEQFKRSALGIIPKDWDVCPIEDKLKKIIDYRGKTPEKVESGIPLITAKNVRKGFIDPEPREYIEEKSYQLWMTRGIPQDKDVLFTTEAPLGNVSLIPNYKIALAQRLLTLCTDKTQLNSDYLIWLLLLPASKRRLEQNSTGSTVLGIKQSVFRKIRFQFPQLHEQEVIASLMNTHEKRIQSKKVYLEKLQLLKKGLMSDLLTGRVRVKI
ncbi:restriction endonuclease subunit S [Nostoc sp.]|uniref:restriction endonuclease subunit S n=1 Tax=Nostoc sp. TaxID=1180 RepID=UPI002FF86590